MNAISGRDGATRDYAISSEKVSHKKSTYQLPSQSLKIFTPKIIYLAANGKSEKNRRIYNTGNK
jgi:hypothetical protein